MKEELTKQVIAPEEAAPDDLIVSTIPAPRIGAGVLRKGTGILKRGTILAKSSKDGMLVILGTAAAGDETLEPFAVLADNRDISAENVPADIYIGGKFNANKVSVSENYTIKESDKDTLRKYNIELTAALKF